MKKQKKNLKCESSFSMSDSEFEDFVAQEESEVQASTEFIPYDAVDTYPMYLAICEFHQWADSYIFYKDVPLLEFSNISSLYNFFLDELILPQTLSIPDLWIKNYKDELEYLYQHLFYYCSKFMPLPSPSLEDIWAQYVFQHSSKKVTGDFKN